MVRLLQMENKMKNLKVGDVVVLKSGGPAMTIKSIEADNATCVWQVNGMHPYVTEVPIACIKHTRTLE